MMQYTKFSKSFRDNVRKILTWISPKLETAIQYRVVCGEWLNWKRPQDINAKLNWLKVNTYYNNPRVTMCIDKYGIREFLAEKGYSDICPKLYGVYDAPDQIEWDKLPRQFAVKCNHACKTNIIVDDKSKLDVAEAVRKLKGWMKMDYWRTGELQYKYIQKRIVAEEYLGGVLI